MQNHLLSSKTTATNTQNKKLKLYFPNNKSEFQNTSSQKNYDTTQTSNAHQKNKP
jgi:hypothetical protein